MSSYAPLSKGHKRPAEDSITPARKRISNGNSETQYWMVQWRAPQTRKHKTWDGDGVLVAEGNKFTLYDMDGQRCVLVTH